MGDLGLFYFMNLLIATSSPIKKMFKDFKKMGLQVRNPDKNEY